MELSRSLLKEFAEVTAVKPTTEKPTYLRGTITSSGTAKYVRIDGSESLTPISEIVDAKVGDRVLVSIENHQATVVGNITKPPSAYKEEEAIAKSEEAKEDANTALEKAETAHTLAQSAGDKADAAVVDATNASTIANQAKQDASEALTAAQNASEESAQAMSAAQSASQNAETAREEAAAAQTSVTAAQGEVTRINGIITEVKGDITTAEENIATQAAQTQAIKETLSVDYAKKTEVSDVQASLTTEISKKVGELQTTIADTYTAKTESVKMEGRLQSQITQTATQSTEIMSRVETLEADTAVAQQNVNDALAKSKAAQEAALQAQNDAAASQTAADTAKADAATALEKANTATQNAATATATATEADRKLALARTDLDEARTNLANTMTRVDATEADILDAQNKVTAAQAAVTQAQEDAAEATLAANNAQAAAIQAQNDATEAQTAATNAQKKADNAALAASNAQAAADKAQQDVAALTKRVTSAETAISQNAEQIKLSATKTEEIGTKLENLQLGGRNILRGTSEMKIGSGTWSSGTWRKSGSGTIKNVTLTDFPLPDITSGIEITSTTGECGIAQDRVKLEKGKYTLSYYVKVNTAGTVIRLQTYWNGTHFSNTDIMINNTNWNRISHTSELSVDVTSINVGYIYTETPNTTITVAAAFEHRSEKEGDWSPAPEDTQSQIDSTNSNLQNNYYSKTQTDAAIKVASDNVTTTVREEVTTEITNVNNKIDYVSDSLRNMWLFTKEYDTTTYDGWGEIYKSGISFKDHRPPYTLIDGFGVQRINIAWYDISQSVPIEIGKTYTLSAMMKWESDIGDMRFIVDGGTILKIVVDGKVMTNLLYGRMEGIPSDRYVRVSATYRNDSSDKTYCRFECADTSPYLIYAMQHEKGDTATPYSRNPNDYSSKQETQQAQNDANEANSKADATEHRVSVAESTIKQLSDSISMLVTDSNGSSMMTQTSDGWTFNIGSITDAINSATNNIDNLSGSLSQTINVVNNLNNLANDLSKKTAYINMTTDETGAPCIELGKSGNAFKVRITNTSVDFIEGSSKIAYVSNQALFIERAIIKSELQVGEKKGFIWKTRSNGNMGLRWFGS